MLEIIFKLKAGTTESSNIKIMLVFAAITIVTAISINVYIYN